MGAQLRLRRHTQILTSRTRSSPSLQQKLPTHPAQYLGLRGAKPHPLGQTSFYDLGLCSRASEPARWDLP